MIGKLRCRRLVTAGIWGLLGCPLVMADYVIHAGRVIDGRSAQPAMEQSIVVKGNRIVAIHEGFVAPGAGEELIDLRDSTLLPGLIDLHTHIDVELSADSFSEGFFKNPADLALRSTRYTRATLLAGFTTVRNLGTESGISLALRDAIKAGDIVGPRIFAAGRAIATTGGHGDATNGLNQHFSRLLGAPGPTEGVINGPFEAREAVRQRYKEGADVLKLTVTGGVISLAKSGENPQFMADELEAIMVAAKDYNFSVAVHAHGAEGMKRAVAAGVDTVEHGTYMTDAIMGAMKKKGIYYVPTLSAGRWVTEQADSYPAIIQPKARAVGPQMEKTFAKAYKNGVKIAFGSDAGVFPHGLNAREFVYMVGAGMSPMEAIQSATLTAAKVLRRDKLFGSVEVNKIADLVAIKGNPLADIGLMTKVDFVMKEGEIVKYH